MKPHPSIFEAALRLIGVPAADAVMVGDSLTQDIDGAIGGHARPCSCAVGRAISPFTATPTPTTASR